MCLGEKDKRLSTGARREVCMTTQPGPLAAGPGVGGGGRASGRNEQEAQEAAGNSQDPAHAALGAGSHRKGPERPLCEDEGAVTGDPATPEASVPGGHLPLLAWLVPLAFPLASQKTQLRAGLAGRGWEGDGKGWKEGGRGNERGWKEGWERPSDPAAPGEARLPGLGLGPALLAGGGWRPFQLRL